MKKIFRMVFVSVLAGAALLYTGCTKDYSEDISNLESKVAANEGSIASLQSQVAALETAKNDLLKAVDAANKEIASLKTALEAVQKTAGDNAKAISTLQKSISDLETTVATCTSKIEAIETELAKKADKTYVDAELAKKADKSWVEENYATAAALSKVASDLAGAVLTINNRLDTIDAEIEAAKQDGAWAKAAIDKAVADITTIFGKIEVIEQALQNIYNKQEVDAIVSRLDADIAKKLDIESYKKDTAVVNANFRAIENGLAAVLNAAAGEDEEAVKVTSENLEEAIVAAFNTKVDKTTFEAWMTLIQLQFAIAEIDIEALINRIQSVVYVPEFADGKITVTYHTIGNSSSNVGFNTEGIESEEAFTEIFNEVYAGEEIDFTNWNAFARSTAVDNPYIVEQATVTYQIDGVDAETTASRLVEVWKTTPEVLSFDLAEVMTRADEEEEVEVKPEFAILDVKADGDKLVIDAVAKNFAYEFFNGGVHPRAGIQSYSVALRISEPMTLVVDEEEEDVTGAGNNFIMSTYENCVATRGENIAPVVVNADDVNVTARQDTLLEVEFTDKSIHSIFENTTLKFQYEGEVYSKDELAEEFGMTVPPIYQGIRAVQNTRRSLDPTKVEADYMNAKDSVVKGDVAGVTTWLKTINPDGVGTVLDVTLFYFVGNSYPYQSWYGSWNGAYTTAQVKVVPHQEVVTVTVKGHKEDVADFVWEYGKDAAVDSALFVKDSTTLKYTRTFEVDFAAAAEQLAPAEHGGLTIADFSHKDPSSVLIMRTVDGKKDTVYCKESYRQGGQTVTEVKKDFTPGNVFTMDNTITDGKLMSTISGFYFDATSYDLQGKYHFPAEKPSIEVVVNFNFTLQDRGREPIVITLPDFVADLYRPESAQEIEVAGVAEDFFAVSNPTIAPVFSTNGLKTNAEIADAFGKKEIAGQNFKQGGTAKYQVRENVLAKWADKTFEDADAQYVTNVDAYKAEDKDSVLVFTTNYVADFLQEQGKVIGATTAYQNVITLWYGQKVTVNKKVTFDVDGTYDFQRIPEYVGKNDAGFYSNVQPRWTKDLPITSENVEVPVTADSKVGGFYVNEVLLNQHFRVVENKKDAATVATEVTGENAGEFTEDYAEILDRDFFVVVADTLATKAFDPRADKDGNFVVTKVDGQTEITKNFMTGIFANYPIPYFGVVVHNFGETKNHLAFYSKSAKEQVYGVLYLVYPSGNKLQQTTSFDRAIEVAANDPARVGEVYDNYVINQYDPIGSAEFDNTPIRVNVNNSTVASAGIKQFLTMTDKRGRALVDEEGNWVVGNAYPAGNRLNNGFAQGKSVDQIFHLVVKYTWEFDTEKISPETIGRFSFDDVNGVVSFNNSLQTGLLEEVPVKLTMSIEYPWGTRTAEEFTKTVTFYSQDNF